MLRDGCQKFARLHVSAVMRLHGLELESIKRGAVAERSARMGVH